MWSKFPRLAVETTARFESQLSGWSCPMPEFYVSVVAVQPQLPTSIDPESLAVSLPGITSSFQTPRDSAHRFRRMATLLNTWSLGKQHFRPRSQAAGLSSLAACEECFNLAVLVVHNLAVQAVGAWAGASSSSTSQLRRATWSCSTASHAFS